MRHEVPREQTEIDRLLRFRIYRHFAAVARAPSAEGLASELDLPVSVVEAGIERLAAARMIALVPGSTKIWMAHPFSDVPTPYPVRTEERTYWANCAWDALGIPALLGVDAETRTWCADCGEPIVQRVQGGRAEPGDAVVHFAVPPRRFWEDVGFT